MCKQYVDKQLKKIDDNNQNRKKNWHRGHLLNKLNREYLCYANYLYHLLFII